MKGFIGYAHTLQNANKYNLVMESIDDYGVPTWIGSKENLALFNLAEADAELL